MRLIRIYIISAVVACMGAFAQSPTTRFALPDSTAIVKQCAADRERILFLLRTMRIGSWNFLWDDSTVRHYGPTAQEFFAALGRDSIGTIGDERGVSPADVDGVALIAIQALEDRTRFLRAALAEKDEEIKDLRIELTELRMAAWKFRDELNQLHFTNVRLQNRLEQLEKATSNSKVEMSSLK